MVLKTTKQLLSRLYFWTLNNHYEHERPPWLEEVREHLADPRLTEPDPILELPMETLKNKKV